MNAQVIPFERFKDVTGWSGTAVRQYVKQHGWKSMHVRFTPAKDRFYRVTIERLPA